MININIQSSIDKLFDFKKDITINGIENPLSKYLSFVWENISFDDFITLINNLPNKKITNHEIYKEYLKKYKHEKIIEIEKEKFLYFLLAYEQKVTLVKTGEKKEEKKFLGYEFSNRRGSEGIHPIQKGKSIDECTSLYDSKSYENSLKVNSYIYSAFDGKEKEIDKKLKDNLTYIDLVDMIDFRRVDFDKFMSVNIKKKVHIKTQWEIVKLGEYIDFCKKSKRPASSGLEKGKYPFFTSSQIQDKWLDDADYDTESIIIGDGGNSSIFISSKFSASDHNFILFSKDARLSNQYIYNFYKIHFDLISDGLQGVTLKNISKNYIQNLKIPLPPKEVQEKIVKEIETIKLIEEKNIEDIENYKEEINSKISSANGEEKELGEICEMKAGDFVAASNILDEKSLENYPCYGGNGLRGYTESFTHDGTYSLIGRQGALCGNIHKVNGKFHATEHALVVTPFNSIDKHWLDYKLREMNLNQYATGAAQPGLSVRNLKNITLEVPSLDIQKKLVKEIEIIKLKITKKESELKNIPNQKEEVLKKHL